MHAPSLLPSRLAAPGLYAITPDALTLAPARLQAAVAGALAGGARVIQYRDKTPPSPAATTRRLANARALVALCRAAGVPLLINDDVELAAASAADGVHLGLTDATLADARRRLGKRAILGATCHADLPRARAALAAGADYVAFGAVHPSPSKPLAPRVTLAAIHAAVQELAAPVCAIGGLTPGNMEPVVAAGVHYVAAIDAVFGDCLTADPFTAARHQAEAFTRRWQVVT